MKYTATDKTAKEKTKSKNIKTRVIPGYHLSLGIVGSRCFQSSFSFR